MKNEIGNSQEQLQKNFRKEVRIIGNYLEQKKINQYPIVSFDEKKSNQIAKYGKQFGVKIENNKIILADWILELQKKEKPFIVRFLLIRESFRIYFNKLVKADYKIYQNFCNVTLNDIALLWLLSTEQMTLADSDIISIRGRMPFKDDDVFNTLAWEWVLIDSHKYGISAFRIFNKLIEFIKEGLEKNLQEKKLVNQFLNWIEAQKEEEHYLALPIYFKQKHFDMIQAMVELGAINASAKNVGKIIGKSYNVVDISFKELFDQYFIFWRAKPNILLLKLYPYFFRLTVKNREGVKQIARKLKPIRYIKDLDYNEASESEFILSGIMECPQVTSNKLSNYFEKLLKQEKINDYFFQMIKKRRGLCSITNNKLELEKETFRKLIENPSQFNIKTLTIFEDENNLSKISNSKKAFFEKDVLLYLSLIAARFLGKAHYMFNNVDKIYEFCQEKNIDIADMRAVKGFISQLDFRMRRLGVIDYFLNIQSIGNFADALYLEIIGNPESKEIIDFIKKISVFSVMIISEFYDRVTIHFPKIKYDTPLKDIIKIELKKRKLEYLLYPFVYYKDHAHIATVQYYELYNFEEKKWKF